MSTSYLETRPNKRSRTQEAGELSEEVLLGDSSSSSSPSQHSESSTVATAFGSFERSTEFWFDDGSIILVAKNTGFRVYRALLARQSTVFSDMFSSSTPNPDEMFDGCPVVHMSDSAEDVAHFLPVLLPSSQRTLFFRHFSFSFDQISAIIRLAHKYDIQDVLDQAIASLQHFFTNDFDIWERKEKQVVAVTGEQYIGVINLARLVDRPLLLPVAFYQCALLDSAVLDGYMHPDGTVEHLNPDDLKHCIDGRNMLAREANMVVSGVFIADPCVPCKTRVTCRNALRSMLESAVVDLGSSCPGVLESWKDAINRWAEEFILCAACQQEAVTRDTLARMRVWNMLPYTFGVQVDGWIINAE